MVLAVASWPSYKIPQEAGKVVWYSHLFKNFPQFVVIYTVKGFSVVNEADVDVFLESPYFLYDPTDVGTLISGSSAFSKSSLYISKFSKPGFNSMWTMNFQMFKLDLEKAEETRVQIANICWIIEKAREFQKNIYFCFIDYDKTLTVWITTNCRQFFKGWEYQTTLSVSWEICMQVKKQLLELDL